VENGTLLATPHNKLIYFHTSTKATTTTKKKNKRSHSKKNLVILKLNMVYSI
jgi:hypothetical protein